MQQNGIAAGQVDAFKTDLLRPAKALGLTDIHSDSQLAVPLTTLYAAVRQARLEADLSVDMKAAAGDALQGRLPFSRLAVQQQWRSASQPVLGSR